MKFKNYKMQMSVILISLLISGCAKVCIEASGTPNVIRHNETVWTSYYDFEWSKYQVRKSTDDIGLYQVVVHKNFFSDIVSVFSLGFVVPIQYEYVLQKEKIEILKRKIAIWLLVYILKMH